MTRPPPNWGHSHAKLVSSGEDRVTCDIAVVPNDPGHSSCPLSGACLSSFRLLNKYLLGIVRGELREGGRTEQLRDEVSRSVSKRGSVTSPVGSQLLQALPPPSRLPCLSIALAQVVYYGHLPLPHAGGPADSRVTLPGAAQGISVLPVPKPHASLGPPGKKTLTTRAAPVFCMGISCSTSMSKVWGICPHICWQLCVPLLVSQLPGSPRGVPSGG